MKGMKDIKCSVNWWVFQKLLTGIVACLSYLCKLAPALILVEHYEDYFEIDLL